MQPGQRILFIVQSPTPTHCNHTFRLVACCSFAGVKRTTRPEHNQSHSRSLGRIELAFNHRWASEQFPSTKFPTWLWSTRGTGFQALSQECRELALNQGPLVYEAEPLTAGPLTLDPRIRSLSKDRWKVYFITDDLLTGNHENWMWDKQADDHTVAATKERKKNFSVC